MTSIARRINRSAVMRLLLAMVFFDALAVVLGGISFMANSDHAFLDPGTPLIQNMHFVWQQTGTFSEKLASVQCVLTLGDGTARTVHFGLYLHSAETVMSLVGIMQLIWLAVALLRGSRRTVKFLRPLEKMAETAEQLSRATFDEQKYHELEHAISALEPSMPEDRLHTGDRELLGLETAVNNLVTRMHESYRQQIRFVSDASHELRTPISVIQGYADMLNRWGAKDEKVLHESIDAIRGETRHMQKLVEQLLFLARGDAGRTQLSARPIDLAQMVKEVGEEYRMINAAHPFQVQADAAVPATGDPEMLKQAARILVDNAVKYSRDGEEVVLRAFVNKDGQPAFSVQDNGAGISAKDMPHIFERFYRADPARTRQMGGTGLGLSIAKWIVDKHDGYFNVLSREGLGTRIEVVLPQGAASAGQSPSV